MGVDGCSSAALESFSKQVRGQMFRVNALLVVNAILMGVMVGIGAYAHRYRHHPLTRFIFLGATVLFIPIISYVLSTISNQSPITLILPGEMIIGLCDPRIHMNLVLIWTGLVQMIGISTTAVVVGDAREGRNIGPSVVLLVQAMWTSYLAVYNIGLSYDTDSLDNKNVNHIRWSLEYLFAPLGLVIFLPFALTFAKLLFKCFAWYSARRSLAIGCNPRLIVGYMEKLQDHLEIANDHQNITPPLIVMGEDTVLVDKKPRGYSFELMPNRDGGLVTLDRVWQSDDMHLKLTTQLKDICFSFALSKLLRCRFARYTNAETGFTKAYKFLWHMLLEDIGGERVLGVIECELCFLHDCYYSSLPISYSKSWLPILSILVSLSSIGCCLVLTSGLILIYVVFDNGLRELISCTLECQVDQSTQGTLNITRNIADIGYSYFGTVYFDLVPVGLLLALVVLAEAREITSYICSNWTKVTLICRYINQASWQKSPIMQKCISRVLQCRCKLLRHWEDKMNQCSILVLHPRKTPAEFLQRLNPLPGHKVKVPRAVKIAIMNALRGYDGSRERDIFVHEAATAGRWQERDIFVQGAKSVTSLCMRLQLQVGGNLLWTFNDTKDIASTILVCHIATSIVEMRSDPHQPLSDHKVAAIHLSRYCAYLVAYSPELLPDDDEGCKSLYKTVKKNAEHILANVSAPEVKYQQLVELMSATQNHEVLKDGAKLGEQLAELIQEGEMMTAWEVLAGFWSEIILYISPSDNLEGHAEAIARGGELITLIWALLAHLGIFSRTNDTAGTTDGGV